MKELKEPRAKNKFSCEHHAGIVMMTKCCINCKKPMKIFEWEKHKNNMLRLPKENIKMLVFITKKVLYVEIKGDIETAYIMGGGSARQNNPAFLFCAVGLV